MMMMMNDDVKQIIAADLSNNLFFFFVIVQSGYHTGSQHVVYQLQKSYKVPTFSIDTA